ncbi:MAG: hypothetical protein O3B01_30905 [Planctomycetota bacterium]|nr:hypothetical protein [Planctomycetota bacterium]
MANPLYSRTPIFPFLKIPLPAFMVHLIQDRPFHFLLPGVFMLATLLAVVQLMEMGSSEVQHLLPPKLGSFQDLLGAPFTDTEIREQARKVFASLNRSSDGLFLFIGRKIERAEFEGFYTSVWMNFDRSAFDILKHYSPEKVQDFVSRGAPLTKWAVTFFDPHKAIEHRESFSIFFDGRGGVAGVQRRLYKPEHIRSGGEEYDLEVWRKRIAGWVGVDENAFRTAGKNELLGSGHESADAAWILKGVELGELRVVVSVRLQNGFLNWQKDILRPVDLSYLSDRRSGKGFAYWAAIFIAVPLAFVAGARLGKQSPIPFKLPLQFVLTTGLILAGVMAMIQAGMLWKQGEWIPNHDLEGTFILLIGFLAGILFLGFVGVAIWRGQMSPEKVGRWKRAMFVGSVPLAFIIMSFSCSGDPFTGCSDVCSIVRMTVMPLSFLSIVLGTNDRRFYAYAIGLCFLGLTPHCICDNFVNHSWITWIGVSPMCYYFPFCVALVAVIGLCGIYPRLCLLAATGSTCGAALLGVGHQLFSWPW